MKKIVLLLAFTLLFIQGCSSVKEGEIPLPSQETEAEDFAQNMGELFTERDLDATYDESKSVTINLKDGGSTASSDSVRIEKDSVILSQEGTYLISGSLSDGSILVEASDSAKLQLVLDGAHIKSENSAAIYVKKADKVFVTLKEKSENTLENGGEFRSVDENNIDGALFSKEDLTLNGNGSLEILSPAGHGIVCKDDLVITGGVISVNAASHTLDANDSVRIGGGEMNFVAGKDGIHVENSEDPSLGFLFLSAGKITVEAQGDGFSASAFLQMEAGEAEILAGGGHENGSLPSSDRWGDFQGGAPSRPGGGMGGGLGGYRPMANTASSDSASMKGMKAESGLLIEGGKIKIDSADDALHSNASLSVTGGEMELITGDDGIHSENTLLITQGNIRITESYEGLEALYITVSGGEIHITASDDGINAAGGTDQSGGGGRDGMFGGFGGMQSAGNGSITVSGGSIAIQMDGDGLDANGSIAITGGNITVCGANRGDTAILDFDTQGVISGGTFIGTGASGMSQNFSSSSTQGVIMLFPESQAEGTSLSLRDESGNTLLENTAERDYSCILLSCPEMEKGKTYTVKAGNFEESVTLSSTVYGNGGGMGGGFGGKGGRF